MRQSLVVLMFLAGCAPEVPSLGGLTLGATDNRLVLQKGDQTLLENALGVAPVATRVGRARYEMQFGSWRITDSRPTWREGTTFKVDAFDKEGLRGTWSGDDGAPVVKVDVRSSAEGVVALTFTADAQETNRLSLALRCQDADRFLGFGGQADGVDHRGHTVTMWTSEPGIGKEIDDDEYPDLWMLVGTRHASSFGLPTWVSNRGYLGLVESDARSIFEVCSTANDVFRIEVWSNTFTLHVYEGAPKQAVERATAGPLGRPLRPPPMAFAPWNDSIFGSAEVRRFAKFLRDEDIPSSAIWTEDFRGGRDEPTGYRLIEEWDTDRTLYPDVEAVAAELADAGYSWQSYFNTFVVTETRIYDEAVAGGHLVGAADGGAYLYDGVTFKKTGMADLSKPATREWVKSYLRKSLDEGFTGWMADYGEWLPHDAVLTSGEDPLLAHNRYALEWATLNQEVMKEREADGVQRLFFSRAGWVGSNKVTPVVWAGDQRTSFQKDDGLFTVIPMGINLGLSGVNTYAHDIAGYQSNTNPPSTKELFFRWTSLGALTPVMRTHHGIDARNNWNLEKDAETTAHYRRWAKVHIQLFPFFDALSAAAEATGVSTLRGLAVVSPGDDRAWTVSDEYCLGDDVLVAPVVDEGATSRLVYFPEGTWVSWDGATRVTGPTEVMVTAPVTELPLFLRAGAVVPRLPARVQTLLPAGAPVVDLEDVAAERVLLVAAGAAGGFTERDGTRYEVTTSGATAFSLPACTSAGQRGCVDGNVARLDGTSLEFPGGVLTISGGPARTYDVEVLR